MASAVLAPAAAGLAARTGRLSGRSLAAKPARALQQIRGLRPVVAMAQKTEKKGKEQEVFLGVKGNAQLLGMKGADMETDIWKIRVQLMKPVTWIPLIWGVLCGAAASGAFTWTPENVAKSLLCMVMSGPLLTGYTQTINDWYDREIDAINEPYRPIPSGRISEGEVIAQIWILLLGGIGVAAVLDLWAGHDFPIMTLLAVFGSFISYIYSAPPLKLKQSGWAGNYALGSSYIALPWWAGQALFGTLTLDVMVLTVLYSIAGLGIAIVNDFKSIEGDRAMGLQSLPVAFGVETAKWICVASIDATQLGVAAYLAFGLDEPIYAAVLLGLILPQIYAQVKYFLPDPVANDVKYQASAQPFLVFGLLTTGLAVGAHNSGAAAAKAAELADAVSSLF
ncbi:chlorophyll synthetase [Chlorella sorokiniana]|uniref:Chlorophyll synthetase n=1 Tax=Chlorella sorokiniana TaxID=3076 RepID=A0A2P6TI09_CHLSO|nr:chlorophyll synthetase [Chlorella sorokiniana]|eukprot:PRW33934.1 chlorophyll synthetase [Chlorella sorokiniana]